MTNSLQHQRTTSRMSLQAVGSVLALAIALLLTVVTTQLAQARDHAGKRNHPPNYPPFTVLHSFTGGADGGLPYGPITLFYKIGYLHYNTVIYGTTQQGGASNFGTVFELKPNGKTETVLYNFTGGADGAYPVAALASPGWKCPFCSPRILFGSAQSGGSFGFGTLFSLDLTNNNTFSVQHSFAQTDGATPLGGMVWASPSKPANLYGTTETGGANGFGTVFNLDPSGTVTTLHDFAGSPTDGANPFGSLILSINRSGVSGNILYGTTETGGAYDAGTVFALNRTTGAMTILWSFTGYADGAYPFGNLVRDPSGALYGTTVFGGANGVGTVFKVSGKGLEKVIYSFAGGSDGAYPYGGLVPDGAGNFFGTTSLGGTNSGGTVFEVTSTGQETVLHRFVCARDGCNPYAGVVRVYRDQRNNGKLFGTTLSGGKGGYGTVFQLKTLP